MPVRAYLCDECGLVYGHVDNVYLYGCPKCLEVFRDKEFENTKCPNCGGIVFEYVDNKSCVGCKRGVVFEIYLSDKPESWPVKIDTD